jgi:hypothetical protein
MKNLKCACGASVNVDDSTEVVICSHCVCTPHKSNKVISLDFKEEKKEVAQKKESVVRIPNVIIVEAVNEFSATGTINGNPFEAKYEVGVDKKNHWVLQGESWTKGERISVARKINKFSKN